MYKDYTISLAYDLAQTKQKRAFSDHSDIVSRRMGFIPLPLGVVMLRVIYTSVKSTNPGALAVVAMAYICLFTFRVLGSIVILGKACDLIDEHKSKQDMKKTSVDETKPSESKTKPDKEDLNQSTAFGSRKVEVIKEKPAVAVAAVPATDTEPEMFQLPDQSSERYFLFQNSCEDRSDVIFTNMNSAMTDDNDESENEMSMNDRELADIVETSEAELLKKKVPVEDHEHRNIEDGDRPTNINVKTPTKQAPASREDSDIDDYTSESLSPATKAKSLSSPDLIRREAEDEFEDWEEERLLVTDIGSSLSPLKPDSVGMRAGDVKNT